MKQILKSTPAKIGIGALITVVVLAFMFIPRDSKLFTGEKKTSMTQTGEGYSIPVLAEDETGGYTVAQFVIEDRVVDSLGFTEAEVKASCGAACDRARKMAPGFSYRETPRLQTVGNKTVAVIPAMMDQNQVFIVGEVTKSGQALPMRIVIPENLPGAISEI
jgi:hypothetical protein